MMLSSSKSQDRIVQGSKVYVQDARVIDLEQRDGYWYVIRILLAQSRSDGVSYQNDMGSSKFRNASAYTVSRQYEHFAKMHSDLLKMMKTELPNDIDLVPTLPKPKLLTTKAIAEERIPVLSEYCQGLLKLYSKLQSPEIILEFFERSWNVSNPVQLPKGHVSELQARHPALTKVDIIPVNERSESLHNGYIPQNPTERSRSSGRSYGTNDDASTAKEFLATFVTTENDFAGTSPDGKRLHSSSPKLKASFVENLRIDDLPRGISTLLHAQRSTADQLESTTLSLLQRDAIKASPGTDFQAPNKAFQCPTRQMSSHQSKYDHSPWLLDVGERLQSPERLRHVNHNDSDAVVLTARSSSISRADAAMQRSNTAPSLFRRIINASDEELVRSNTEIGFQPSPRSSGPGRDPSGERDDLPVSAPQVNTSATLLKRAATRSPARQQQVAQALPSFDATGGVLLPHQAHISLAAEPDSYVQSPITVEAPKKRPGLLRNLSRRQLNGSPLPQPPWNSQYPARSLSVNDAVNTLRDESPAQQDRMKPFYVEEAIAPEENVLRGRTMSRRERRVNEVPYSRNVLDSDRSQSNPSSGSAAKDESVNVKIVLGANDILNIRICPDATFAELCKRADRKLEAVCRLPLGQSGTLSYFDSDRHRVRLLDEDDWEVVMSEWSSRKIVLYLN
ncbi:hypothetical protein SeLEV6574_g07965 [Synchytrium endobioticum]|uniref:PX domain-containing protein n=1 Tax=Synchytrium endobioticum TaxID=286115 RepID=A0A507C768_9FUNG|nr:hypothetical protein SeLEV6574_g07965 [Synchytrium endobioticum]